MGSDPKRPPNSEQAAAEDQAAATELDLELPAVPATPATEHRATELDLSLPTDIALRHAEASFESKETLPRLDLPDRPGETAPPETAYADPPFDPQDFPALGSNDRTTELEVPAVAPTQDRPGSPLLWALIGAGIATALATMVYFAVLR